MIWWLGRGEGDWAGKHAGRILEAGERGKSDVSFPLLI